MQDILISGCTILTMEDTSLCPFTGYIAVSGGKLEYVGAEGAKAEKFLADHPGCLRKDGSGMLAMPGLVNTHNHVSMSLMRSYADDLSLMCWLHDHIWPFEKLLTPEDIYWGARLGIAEMLLGGTTTFADMYWSEESVARAVEQAGIRAVLSPTFTDDKFDDFLADFDRVYAAYGDGQDPLISLMIAPHSPYTCSEEHLNHALQLSRKTGTPLNIHVAETKDEIEIVRQRFGKTPVEHLSDLGLLKPGTLAVHCVHVTPRDIDIMAAAGVCVAHNPQSNMKLASGTAPVRDMIRAGIRVSIGTDGPSSNNDLDMWDEMRSASFLQKLHTGDPTALPAYEILQMATIDGARALGIDDRIGSLREGKQADLILVNIDKPHHYPHHDITANMVYSAKSSDVDTVIVNGRVLVEKGEILSLDLHSLCRQAQQRAFTIAEKAKRNRN